MLQFSFPTLFGLIFTLLRGLSSDRPCSPYETFGGSALLRLMTITSERVRHKERKKEIDATKMHLCRNAAVDHGQTHLLRHPL